MRVRPGTTGRGVPLKGKNSFGGDRQTLPILSPSHSRRKRPRDELPSYRSLIIASLGENPGERLKGVTVISKPVESEELVLGDSSIAARIQARLKTKKREGSPARRGKKSEEKVERASCYSFLFEN